MAKQSDKIITETDLTEFLKTQDDFRLELAAYRACKKMGFNATHGGTYADHVSHLHIVTLSGFKKLLARLKANGPTWPDVFPLDVIAQADDK